MHTIDLRTDMFDVMIDGHRASLDRLFPEWKAHDRFGIVVDTPYGATGASLLIQAAITKFFQGRPHRDLKIAPMYPEIYAFHIGGPHGDLSLYDFWPATKEVFLPPDPTTTLQAINDRAITRLAVPDGPRGTSSFLWPEYGSARSRISTCWAYSRTGRATNSDVVLGSSSPEVETNTTGTFELAQYINSRKLENELEFAKLMRDDLDFQRWIARTVQRQDEVSTDAHSRAAESHAQKRVGRIITETYRRVDLEFTLSRLASCCSSVSTH